MSKKNYQTLGTGPRIYTWEKLRTCYWAPGHKNKPTTSQTARRKKQAWKKAEGRRKQLLVHLAVGRVVAAMGTPVRGNRRDGTFCRYCWSEAGWWQTSNSKETARLVNETWTGVT